MRASDVSLCPLAARFFPVTGLAKQLKIAVVAVVAAKAQGDDVIRLQLKDVVIPAGGAFGRAIDKPSPNPLKLWPYYPLLRAAYSSHE